jgi:hypothetical protein
MVGITYNCTGPGLGFGHVGHKSAEFVVNNLLYTLSYVLTTNAPVYRTKPCRAESRKENVEAAKKHAEAT